MDTRTDCDCSTCGAKLVSMTELSLGLCMTCVSNVISERGSLMKKNDELAMLALEQKLKIDSYEENRRHNFSIFKAEKAGQVACERGLGFDENPYNDGDDERDMWSYGWNQKHIEQEEAKMRAVISWAVVTLGTADELSLDGGDAVGDEISMRIRLVIEKMSQFIEEDVDMA